MIELMIIDDQASARTGVHMLLDLEPDIHVVGEAANREEALARFESLRPDLVLLDLALPGTDGIELARELLALAPALKIVILTLHDTPANRARAAQAGAVAFAGKHEGSPALLAAIRSAL
jgi:two-component system, NarL family, response regulator NreC